MVCADETMCAFTGTGMQGVSKIKRKPTHISVGRELKTIACVETKVIFRVDPVCSSLPARDYDADFGRRKSVAASLRLCAGLAGRLLIADSWFGTVHNCVALKMLGVYSILNVKKRKHWAQFFPKDMEDDLGAQQVGGCLVFSVC